MDISALTFDDRGLIPCIVQDARTKDVLMMAWMSEESIALTLERGETVFWSRSRQELWHKGRHAARPGGSRRPCLPYRRDELFFPHVALRPARRHRAEVHASCGSGGPIVKAAPRVGRAAPPHQSSRSMLGGLLRCGSMCRYEWSHCARKRALRFPFVHDMHHHALVDEGVCHLCEIETWENAEPAVRHRCLGVKRCRGGLFGCASR